jgi:hypothetical protein
LSDGEAMAAWGDEDRRQEVLLLPCLDDYMTENIAVPVIEAFVDELDLATLGFVWSLRSSFPLAW